MRKNVSVEKRVLLQIAKLATEAAHGLSDGGKVRFKNKRAMATNYTAVYMRNYQRKKAHLDRIEANRLGHKTLVAYRKAKKSGKVSHLRLVAPIKGSRSKRSAAA